MHIRTTSFSNTLKRWKKLDLFASILVNKEVIPVVIIPFKTMTPATSFNTCITFKLFSLLEHNKTPNLRKKFQQQLKYPLAKKSSGAELSKKNENVCLYFLCNPALWIFYIIWSSHVQIIPQKQVPSPLKLGVAMWCHMTSLWHSKKFQIQLSDFWLPECASNSI